MLFPYKPISHSMDKMQSYIDFIFYEVWCNAPHSKTFSLELFNNYAELKEIMTRFDYDDNKSGDRFYALVEEIYTLFSSLTQDQLEQLQRWYVSNNDIENACANTSSLQLVRYTNIAGLNQNFVNKLKAFYTGLYDHSLLTSKPFKEKIGDMTEHFNQFRKANGSGKCPFCGINDLKCENQTYRDAYDHYLPKSLYPFNSINFKNLAPACHDCNSVYKRAKDPVFCNGSKRKAFYPYSQSLFDIDFKISLNLNEKNWENIAFNDIAIELVSEDKKEEIETWKDVYGIEERYKSKCCSEDDGKEWFVQVMDEWEYDDKTPEEYLETLKRHCQRNPYSDLRFLKYAFLTSCNKEGLFEYEKLKKSK